MESQKYLYYDANYQTYLPAELQVQQAQAQAQLQQHQLQPQIQAMPQPQPQLQSVEMQNTTAVPQIVEEKPEPPKSTPAKPKSAKEIQKEMEKWAKKQEQALKKEKTFNQPIMMTVTPKADPIPASAPGSAADLGFSILEVRNKSEVFFLKFSY